MDVYRNRRERVQHLIDTRFKTKAAFAEAAGVDNPSTVSRWFLVDEETGKYYKNIGEELARRIERKLDLQRYELDRPLGVDAPKKEHNGQRPSRETSWPFAFSPDDFLELDPDQQIEIGEIVEDRVQRFKAKNGPRRRKKSDE
jgi:hypothetical protein